MVKQKRAARWRARVPAILSISALFALTIYALFGPGGIISMSDYKVALVDRQGELKQLDSQHAALKNRVERLDPANVDPDLGGELIRKELGVVAPNEIVIPLD